MKLAAALLLLLAAAPLAAQTLPDLRNQAAWKEKDKQDFLKYLKAGQSAPANGQVKSVPGQENGSSKIPYTVHKARYLALPLAMESIITVDHTGRQVTGDPAFTAGLLAGGHLFSWIRYYGGVRFGRMTQDKLDGRASGLKHYEVPLGIELALIPLGTPHTRYVLLRGGVSAHYFGGDAPKSAFAAPLEGWHDAWNFGVGYEWQIEDSNLRVNVLAETCKSFDRDPQFYKAGLTAGLAYTF